MKALVYLSILLFVTVSIKGDNLKNILREELMKKLQEEGSQEITDDDNGPDHKIVGGTTAAPGLVPYQALIMLISDIGTQYCGGTLISRRHVLTAAHCLDQKPLAVVKLGTTYLKKVFGPGITFQVVHSKYFEIHPDYDEESLLHDIAIIQLPEPVVCSFKVRAINLPTDNMTATDYFAKKEATISGFGVTSDDTDYPAEKLQIATVKIIRHSRCKSNWSKAITLEETQVCSTSRPASTCRGDSGGPMVVTMENKKYLVGVTSFGNITCNSSAPSIYTNVPSYLPWIRAVTNL